LIQKNHLKIILLLFFIASSIALYLIVNLHFETAKEQILKHHTEKQVAVFETIYNEKKELSKHFYDRLLYEGKIAQRLYLAKQDSSLQAQLRHEILRDLGDIYTRLKIIGVRQLHIHLANNSSFLRLHKPSKHGDDLSQIRESVVYVNKTHQPIDTFEEGKMYNGFRFVYPISYNNHHIGSIEISFSAHSIIKSIIKKEQVLSNLFIKSEVVKKKVDTIDNPLYIFNKNNNMYMDKEVVLLIEKNTNKSIQKLEPRSDFCLSLAKIADTQKPSSLYHSELRAIFTVIPLINKITKKTIGYITIRSKNGIFETFDRYALIFFLLGNVVLMVIFGYIYNITALNKKLKKAHKKMQKMATVDNLTQLYNRHRLEEILIEHKQLHERYGASFAIIIADIDGFKQINDTYGHLVGDEVLKEFANVIKKSCRQTDVIGRWGGEEFIFVIPHATQDATIALAKHLQDTIQKHQFTKIGQLTASFGVALHKKEESGEQCVNRADQAMYISKSEGKNRVTFKE
jgi:diguanylate cyclase (GGDEF)-like protein